MSGSSRDDLHRRALSDLGVPPPALEPLATYLDALARWSPRVNLTAARTPEERVRVLVADPLRASPEIPPGRLIDVGSGNGSPGLVLALLREDLEVTLLEPRMRRWAFLRDAARGAGRGDVQILRLRHDAYRGEPARSVTLRGLALPLEALAGLALEGGGIFVFGGSPRAGPGVALLAERPLSRSRLFVFRRQRST